MRVQLLFFSWWICFSGGAQSPTIPEYKFMWLDNDRHLTQKNLVPGKASLFIF